MRTRLALVVSSLVVVLVVLADHRSNVGAVVVLAFLMIGPGAAFARLVRFPEASDGRAVACVLAIGVSFAIDALVTEAMVYAHVWTAPRGLIVICVLVLLLVAAEWAALRPRPTRAC